MRMRCAITPLPRAGQAVPARKSPRWYAVPLPRRWCGVVRWRPGKWEGTPCAASPPAPEGQRGACARRRPETSRHVCGRLPAVCRLRSRRLAVPAGRGRVKWACVAASRTDGMASFHAKFLFRISSQSIRPGGIGLL
jgi:hypothetical protein